MRGPAGAKGFCAGGTPLAIAARVACQVRSLLPCSRCLYLLHCLKCSHRGPRRLAAGAATRRRASRWKRGWPRGHGDRSTRSWWQGRSSPVLHGGNAPLQNLSLLEALLQLLLAQLVLDVETEGHGTLSLLAVFGMVTTQGDKLLADGAASVGLALAALGVLHHPLHAPAAGQAAVGVPALARMHQGVDAALNGQPLRLLRVALLGVGCGGPIVQVKAQLLHFVRMAFTIVAGHTQVKVIAYCTVVTCLHMALAAVACVHESILALVVKLVKHGHGRVLGAPK
ncbi:hypothetical protein MTO96_001953 [Rhipicephalus appendiculatus]